MSSKEPFRRLVKLVARAFYDDDYSDKSSNKRADKGDNRGVAVVLLDALARREWIKEDELAKQLHLNPKQVRRILKMLEAERLVVREKRREAIKKRAPGEGNYSAAAEQRERQKNSAVPYCCLDYAQVVDVVRYRIHRAKKKIKDELDNRKVEMTLLCPNASCGQRFSTLDTGRLIDPVDFNLKCERCSTELISEADKMAAEAMGEGGEGGGGAGEREGDDNVRLRRREMLKDLLERMESQLKPLTDQLLKVKELSPPHCGTLAVWWAQASLVKRNQATGLESAAAAGAAGGGGGGGVRGGAGAGVGLQGANLPFMGETKVEVLIGGDAVGGGAEKEEKKAAAVKVIPAWAIREEMSLTAAQRGEVEETPEEGKVKKEEASTVGSEEEEAEKRRIQEYYAAYMAAIMQQQQLQQQLMMTQGAGVENAQPGIAKQEEAAVTTQIDGELGEDEGVEWEDGGDEQESVKEDVKMEEGDGGDEEDYEWEDGGAVDEPQSSQKTEIEKTETQEDEDDVEWDE